ncbi:hypothetical protein [Bradyrhizobium sp. Leo121]|uniref:hypothetical protein n=1 Tax=Bradyrhizobium sp. Leo121 TaxID=1571195 RepID=UPI001FE06416|nr:hypothetical protein [Bradyrhizobium sp. Leo121]
MAILSFLGGPVIKGLIDAYNAHLKATTDDKAIAADLAGKEIAAQTVELQEQGQTKRAQIGHPWEPEKLFGYLMVIYFGKLTLWDKVIGSFAGYTANIFNTDPLTGEALTWAGWIMVFYVGKRGFENIARILKQR